MSRTHGLRVAVFGLGEAGTLMAADLAAAGMEVNGYDPKSHPTPDGVTGHADPRDAVAGADLVIALTAAADATEALCQALEAIPTAALYADLTTASAARKRELAVIAGHRGLAFVDAALMSPVPGKGIRTPQLASGPGAVRYAEMLTAAGAPVTAIGGAPGDAATHKVLRSIVMKGLATLVIEAMRAGEAAGLGEWLWRHLVAEVTAADEALLRRLVEGTAPHAARRRQEMEGAVELLEELGVAALMSQATVKSLQHAAERGVPDLPSAG